MKFYNLIKTVICNNIFPKLNTSDQTIIIIQVNRLLTEINSKVDLINLYDQLSIEFFKDIYILVNMILPFIEEINKPKLKNLSDIPYKFTNLNYNLPQKYVFSEKDVIENTNIIIENINKYDILNKLYVNWLDVFPQKNSDGFLSKIELAPAYRDKDVKKSSIWRYIENKIKKNKDEYADAQYFFSKKTNNKYKMYKDTEILQQLQDINKYDHLNWMNADTFYWLNQIHFFNHLIEHRVIYLTAGTGVGKSTHLPKLAIYGLIAFLNKPDAKIIITQPRQIPTQDVPGYISKNMGFSIKKYNELNGTDNSEEYFYIQFQHGEKKHISKNSKADHKYLKYVTDQILFNKIIENPSLKDKNNNNIYDIVMIDEAHEHNINMDLILTLMNNTLQLNHDIKLVIISATMESDEPRYRQYFNNINDKFESNIGIKSRIDRRLHIANPLQKNRFPIVEYFLKEKISDYVTNSINKIKQILKESDDGDILLFLTGQSEINNACTILNNETPSNIIVLPLLRDIEDQYKEIVKSVPAHKITINKNDVLLPIKEQRKVYENTYTRKVIIATAIAEASLTIDTLKYMVNILKTKSNIYNPDEKLAKLVPVPISFSSHTQRRGRVGRTRPGICYYLYTQEEVINNNIIANITTSDLTEILLNLLKQDKNDNNLFSREQLEDINGTFYIIHPSDYGYKLKRNYDGSFKKKLTQYENKNIIDAFENLLDLKLININGYKTNLAKILQSLLKLSKKDIGDRLFLIYGELCNLSKYTLILQSFTELGNFETYVAENKADKFFSLWSNKYGDHYSIIMIVSKFFKLYNNLFIVKYGKSILDNQLNSEEDNTKNIIKLKITKIINNYLKNYNILVNNKYKDNNNYKIEEIIKVESDIIKNWCTTNYINIHQFIKFLDNLNKNKLLIKEIKLNLDKLNLNLKSYIKTVNYSNWFNNILELYKLSYPRNIGIVNNDGIYTTKFNVKLNIKESKIEIGDNPYKKKIYSTTYKANSSKIFFNKIRFIDYENYFTVSYITKLN